MKDVISIFKKDRLYVLLLIFILVFNILALLPHEEKKSRPPAGGQASSVSGKSDRGDMLLKKEDVEKALRGNTHLALLFTLASLLITSALLLGIVIDVMILSSAASGKRLDIATYKLREIRWSAWDVGKVVILFLFFGYMLVIIESALIKVFPLVKDDNFRMVFNSSVMDVLGVIFILYFTAGRYKEKLTTLGISAKNFFKNVFYGVVGYLAIVPVLMALLVAIAVFANLIKYVPPQQAVVELFMKEKGSAFLLYTSVFAAILGPVVEELFFRSFMYSAFKKYIGIFWAMMLTSALFAALHTHAVGFLPIMALGLLLAYLYEKTGTLVSSITVHAMHNLSMVLLVFLIKEVKV